MKVLRYFNIFILWVLIIVPVSTVTFYYFSEFVDYKPKIESFILNAHIDEQDPPLAVEQFIRASHNTGFGFSYHVMRQVEFKLKLSRVSNIKRIIRGISWRVILNTVFTESELYTLYCTLAFYVEGAGLNNLANERYSKNLSELSYSETASIVAVLRAPQILLKDESRLNEMTDILISRVESANQ